MKVLLRNRTSGKFYVAENTWSARSDEAWDFKSFASVLEHLGKNRMNDIEVFYSFEEPEMDFTVSLDTHLAQIRSRSRRPPDP